jgi:hypothetical protein
VTSLLAHGIWLTLVLCDSGVDGLDDIGSDWRGENLLNPNQLSIPKSFINPFEIVLAPIIS